MKTVKVLAANLRTDDVMDGMRIKAIHKYPRRPRRYGADKHDKVGVLVVMPHPKGYRLVTRNFNGALPVKVKRPVKNMKRYR